MLPHDQPMTPYVTGCPLDGRWQLYDAPVPRYVGHGAQRVIALGTTAATSDCLSVFLFDMTMVCMEMYAEACSVRSAVEGSQHASDALILVFCRLVLQACFAGCFCGVTCWPHLRVRGMQSMPAATTHYNGYTLV